MKLSIIIAAKNMALVLPRALNSIFSQTCENVEVLVADGGSTDGTVEYLNSVENTRLAWWDSESDNSLYEAWNRALSHISGDWVLFLGADDELYDNSVVEYFIDYVSKTTAESDIFYGIVEHVDASGLPWCFGGEPWEQFSKKFMLKGQMFAHQAVFHNARLFRSGERFDASFRISGDYDLLLRVLKQNEPVFIDNYLVARMHYGGVSSGFNNVKLYREMRRARRKNGYSETIWTLLLRLRYLIRTILCALLGKSTAVDFYNFIRRLLGRSKVR